MCDGETRCVTVQCDRERRCLRRCRVKDREGSVLSTSAHLPVQYHLSNDSKWFYLTVTALLLSLPVGYSLLCKN